MIPSTKFVDVRVRVDNGALAEVTSFFIQKALVLHNANPSSTIVPNLYSAYLGIHSDLRAAMDGLICQFTSVPVIYADLRNALLPKQVLPIQPEDEPTNNGIGYNYKFVNVSFREPVIELGTLSDEVQIGMHALNPPENAVEPSLAVSQLFEIFGSVEPLVDPSKYEELRSDPSAFSFEQNGRVHLEVPIQSLWLANLCLSRNTRGRFGQYCHTFYGPPALSLENRFRSKLSGAAGGYDFALKTNVNFLQLIDLCLGSVVAIQQAVGYSSKTRSVQDVFSFNDKFYFSLLVQYIIMNTYYGWSAAFVAGDGVKWGTQYFPMSKDEQNSLLIFSSLGESLRRYHPITNIVGNGRCTVFTELVYDQDPRFVRLEAPPGWADSSGSTPFDWQNMSFGATPLTLGLGVPITAFSNYTTQYRQDSIFAQPFCPFLVSVPFREINQEMLTAVFNLYYGQDVDLEFYQFYFGEFPEDQSVRLMGVLPYVKLSGNFVASDLPQYITLYQPKQYTPSQIFNRQNIYNYARMLLTARGSEVSTQLAKSDRINAELGNGAIGISTLLLVGTVTATTFSVIGATAGLIAESVSLAGEIKQLNRTELRYLAQAQIDSLVNYGINFQGLYGTQRVKIEEPYYDEYGAGLPPSIVSYSVLYNEVMGWIVELYQGKDYIPELPMHYLTMLVQLLYLVQQFPPEVRGDTARRLMAIPGWTESQSGFCVLRASNSEQDYLNAVEDVTEL